MKQRVRIGNCRKVLRRIPRNTFSAVVTDPPYGLKFMCAEWDHGVPGVEFWKEILRVAKPGAPLLAFGGTRTYHRLTCAVEDAGWEIRDCLMWLYGQGFPKSLDVSKVIDRAAGIEREVVGGCSDGAIRRPRALQPGGALRQSVPSMSLPATDAARLWNGWRTALKPAYEPVVFAMKPLDGTFAENAQRHGVAGLNIDASRIGVGKGGRRDGEKTAEKRYADRGATNFAPTPGPRGGDARGRWPANVILTHHPECVRRGVKRVKGSNFEGAETGRVNTVFGKDHRSREAVGYADADGLETVEDWDCRPDCPVGMLGEQSGTIPSSFRKRGSQSKGETGSPFDNTSRGPILYKDTGTAARFFYTSKASRRERTCGGKVTNIHPTVKPLAIMEYLLKLVSMPQGNYILDPFCGSGSTLVACKQLGLKALGIDNDPRAARTAFRRLHETQRSER